MIHRSMQLKRKKTKKDEGRALEIEADRPGLKYLNLEVVQNGGGAKAWRQSSQGGNHSAAPCGPLVPGKYNCPATSAISCLRHRHDCRVWLHLILIPLKLRLAHRDTVPVPGGGVIRCYLSALVHPFSLDRSCGLAEERVCTSDSGSSGLKILPNPAFV